MIHTLPGGILEMNIQTPRDVGSLMDSLFTAGGLVLSQISNLTGLEMHMVQNWVKRGFLPPPQRKKYNRAQLCRILIINMLRSTMHMELICTLLTYINGNLADTGDDAIDDSQLYLYLLGAILYVEEAKILNLTELRRVLSQETADYAEPFPGAKKRVLQVLEILTVTYCAARLKGLADDLYADLDL